MDLDEKMAVTMGEMFLMMEHSANYISGFKSFHNSEPGTLVHRSCPICRHFEEKRQVAQEKADVNA